jgi:hypothetical protein
MMAERIMMLLIVYSLILFCDRARLFRSFSWRVQGTYMLLLVITFYLSFNYAMQWKLPFLIDAVEYVFAVPSKQIAVWFKSGS